MNRIIIIQGPIKSGKTRLIREIIGEHSRIVIDYNRIEDPFAYQNMTDETKYLIVDRVIFSSNIIQIMDSSEILVNRKYKSPITVKRPILILETKDEIIDAIKSRMLMDENIVCYKLAK